MSEFTLLSEKDLNELTKLRFNRRPKFTDYAILTGCQGFKGDEPAKWLLSSEIKTHEAIVNEDDIILDLGPSHIYPAAVDAKGKITYAEENKPFYGIRPVTKLTEDIAQNIKITKENKDIIKLEYGELPQNIVPEEKRKTLSEKAQDYDFSKNVKRYKPVITYYNPANPNNFKIDRIKMPYKEYVLDDKKFVLMVTSRDFLSVNSILNDKTKVLKDQEYWIEVKSVKWTYDKKLDLMISDKVLFTGEMTLNKIKDYMYFYEDTDVYKYLNEIFAKDIIPSTPEKKLEKSLVKLPKLTEQRHMR